MKHDQIRIVDCTAYSGRNIYSHRPVIKLTVNIGRYGRIPTKEIPGFHTGLLRLFPGLKTNCCSLGYEGGFVERLRSGTYLAHVLEHVILEMQAMVGYDIRFGKTRTLQEPSLYYLVYEYENEVCALECGKVSVVILNHLLRGEHVRMQSIMSQLRRVSRQADLGPSTTAIAAEAKKRGIPVTRIGNGSLIRLGYGCSSRLLEATLTDTTSCISSDISCNKQLTKYLLHEHKVPVPRGRVVYSELSAQMAACQLGTPVAVKPFNGNQGKGVHLNLHTAKEIRDAFRDASRYSSGILIEQYVSGHDYRILVVGNRISAVAQRIPACVTGDGLHAIRELVALVNRDPNRGSRHEKPLTKLRLDQTALNLLHRNNLSPDSVPGPGQAVFLRENGNMSTGGSAVDCTDLIHPDNAQLAIRAANAVGVDIAGIDIVTEDISKPISEHGGVVIEVNAAPGIRMHLYPSAGQPRSVAKDIVDYLFPNENAIQFPLVSVTGTNGKTTVARLVQHGIICSGKTVGLTSTTGTFINDTCICKGDHAGARSARALLADKSIQAAVLETARGGILRDGLGYDLATVGIITNITGDHLGLDGINTLEELIFIKSLVAEAVKRDGAAVLNATDSSTPAILGRIRARPILFGIEESSPQSLIPDCTRVFTRNGWICVNDGVAMVPVVSVRNVPITCGGIIRCNVENALAATAALHALEIPVDTIRTSLLSFTENTGRFQMFELNGARIMLDYGHNPAGYEQVLSVCKQLEHQRLVGIIGMPGDRRDRDIKQAGTLCAGILDRIYIKEDSDLRGRAKGEVADLFYQTVVHHGFPSEYVTRAESERAALEEAILVSKPGDLIVLLYEDYEPLRSFLEERGASSIPAADMFPRSMAASDWKQTIV